MKLVENLDYWANYEIFPEESGVTNPKLIFEDAVQIMSQNFNLPLASAQAMVLAVGRATGEAGLIVDEYTNAYYQFCLMMSEAPEQA